MLNFNPAIPEKYLTNLTPVVMTELLIELQGWDKDKATKVINKDPEKFKEFMLYGAYIDPDMYCDNCGGELGMAKIEHRGEGEIELVTDCKCGFTFFH